MKDIAAVDKTIFSMPMLAGIVEMTGRIVREMRKP